MWKVRESQPIGVKVFYEVFRELPTGGTVFRGRYERKEDAQQLADKLNGLEDTKLERIQ